MTAISKKFDGNHFSKRFSTLEWSLKTHWTVSIKDDPGKARSIMVVLKETCKKNYSCKNLSRILQDFLPLPDSGRKSNILQDFARFALVVRNLQETAKIWIKVRLGKLRTFSLGFEYMIIDQNSKFFVFVCFTSQRKKITFKSEKLPTIFCSECYINF